MTEEPWPGEEAQRQVVRCVRQNGERQADAVKMGVKEDGTVRKCNREIERQRLMGQFAMFPVTHRVNDKCIKLL